MLVCSFSQKQIELGRNLPESFVADATETCQTWWTLSKDTFFIISRLFTAIYSGTTSDPQLRGYTSGSSFESDPFEDSHEDIPLQMSKPMSPVLYYIDIQIDVVHDYAADNHAADHHAAGHHAAHAVDYPAAHAAAGEDVPHFHAEAPPAAQPELAPTDPAIVAILEMMAEMVNLQHQALNAQRVQTAPVPTT